MELTQSFTVNHPARQVWDFFGNIDEVVTCMPGAALTAPSDGQHIEGKIGVKLGPISTNFAGEADLERDDQARVGVIRGGGRDNRSGSRAKGEVRYTLVEENEGASTRVDIVVEFTLSGALAQFNRPGLVNDLAGRLTDQFAANLQAKLDAAGGGEAAADAAAPAEAGEAAAQIDAGSLLWAVIWDRIKAFFKGLFGGG